MTTANSNNQKKSGKVQVERLSLAMIESRSFLIPSYQRPYVWSEEDVTKLLDDIKHAIGKESQYFIGNTLSALQTPDDKTDSKSTAVYELIDGQQRMTTLMLLSIAFKALEVDCDLAKAALLGNESRLSFEIRDSVQSFLTDFAKPHSERATQLSADQIKKDEYLKPLAENLEVMTKWIENLRRSNPDQSSTQPDIKEFADFLYKRVFWVNNIVPGTMDLNRLFYSMNTAGIQLQPVDLLKARLLGKIETEKLLYSTIWQACESMDSYFERSVRNYFDYDDSLAYESFCSFNRESFSLKTGSSGSNEIVLASPSSLASVIDCPEEYQPNPNSSTGDESPSESVDRCRSIISFDLLLIHTLRIFTLQEGRDNDLKSRINERNLLACFDELLDKQEDQIKRFFELLWQVRFQFDRWIIKWVTDRDETKGEVLNFASPSSPPGRYRTAREGLSCLQQLQSMRYFTGERSAQYWLTPFLAKLVAQPNLSDGESEVLGLLEKIDNQLSLTTKKETQKDASFKLAKGVTPDLESWGVQEKYLQSDLGTGFEHYWFQKLEYLLWKEGRSGDDPVLKSHRITSKNSIEHVFPQNEKRGREIGEELHSFGNLALLSTSENSSYSNQPVHIKKSMFDDKVKTGRYDSLKLNKIFELYGLDNQGWTAEKIEKHQDEMIAILYEHYEQGEKYG